MTQLPLPKVTLNLEQKHDNNEPEVEYDQKY